MPSREKRSQVERVSVFLTATLVDHRAGVKYRQMFTK